MNLLTIGGSDPTSGAGVQADIKATSDIGVHCLCIVTAITGQNTRQFATIETVSPRMIKSQLDAVTDDFEIDAIKIGMVYNTETIDIIRHYIAEIDVPIIVDPVIRSTTGGMLITESAIKDLRRLVADSTIVTPNITEAEILAGMKLDHSTPEEIATSILDTRVPNVIITGIHIRDEIVDLIAERDQIRYITGVQVPGENHGSGCNFATAIAVGLGSKMTVYDAALYAKKMTLEGIKSAVHLGQGIPITNTRLVDDITRDITYNILELVKMDHVSNHIPECQTNFVYARKRPQSLNDVVGVRGRIVKSGKRVVIAGDIVYGGSKHVATAIVTVNKRFPDIRSAINIMYNIDIIKRAASSGMVVLEYDRQSEPTDIRVGGSSISWGVQEAIRDATESPDIIYHTGDLGKEPMIIIFGTRPDNVLQKLSKLITET